MNSKLKVHALGENDTFIVVSLADGSNKAKVHFQGDEADLAELLGIVQDAIMGEADSLH